ncbi:MAG: caspase family protein [Myxococcota bacterium]
MLWLLLTLSSVAQAGKDPSSCPTLDGRSKLVGKAGQRRVALLVGVGEHLAEVDGKPLRLSAASDDAMHMRAVLTETFGFPERNVCVLRDARATQARFLEALDRHFAGVSEGDSVVFYFAGYGSQTRGGEDTYVLHDSRTGDARDVATAEVERRLVQVYGRTTDLTVLIDASHAGGPREGRPHEGSERWLPPAKGGKATGIPGPDVAEVMPKAVWLHAAPSGEPALERDGQGVFTASLLHALRERPRADWDQILHDTTRWTAALHSWQRPTGGGDLERAVWTPVSDGGSWAVEQVDGPVVQFRGAVQPGFSAGALVSVPRGKEVTLVRLNEVADGRATGAIVNAAAKSLTPGAKARLEVPGRDLTAVGVSFQGPVRWTRETQAALQKAVERNPVLAQTIRFVERGADYILRPGPSDTIDIVGADGVRRNRLSYPEPTVSATMVAETIGLFARQAALLALSGEVPAEYPDNMFELRIQPLAEKAGCERSPYAPTGRAVPWAQVPMCNAVTLAIRWVEEPKRPLYLGVLYLSGNGDIETWPPRGRQVALTSQGEEHVQVLGWVTPPLHTPDRILVFGTHEPVDWARLEANSPADVVSRGIGELDFFIAAIAGTKTRGEFVRAGHSVPAWTASLVSVEVTADPERWSPDERDAQVTCQALRKAGCVNESRE